jgi:hypothetical protein
MCETGDGREPTPTRLIVRGCLFVQALSHLCVCMLLAVFVQQHCCAEVQPQLRGRLRAVFALRRVCRGC